MYARPRLFSTATAVIAAPVVGWCMFWRWAPSPRGGCPSPEATHTGLRLAFDQGQNLRRWRKLGDIDLGEIAERCERLAQAAAQHPIDTAGIAADTLELGLYRERKLMGLELYRRGPWRRRRSSSFRRRSLRWRRFVSRLCWRRRWCCDRGSLFQV